MGMGRGTQNASSGMQGKGGAARPSGDTQTQMGNLAQRFGGDVQQARSLGAKGMGQQPPQVQQPTAGMGGKGQLSGGQPMQQSNLNNALSGLAGAPAQTYPFPQPPTQQLPQVQPGMGGKGLGQQVLPEYAQPYAAAMVQPPAQVQPRTQQDADLMAQQAFNRMQSGMGGKGLGQQQTDPRMQQAFEAMQAQSQMRGQPMQQPQRTPTPSEMVMLGMGQQPDLAAQRAAFDAANAQPVTNPMNDPYAARFGVPGDYVGTPAPVQVQQPTQSALDAAYRQNLISSAGSGLSPVRQLAPVQPAFTPQPVRAENPRLAQQRQLQQRANRRRFGRR